MTTSKTDQAYLLAARDAWMAAGAMRRERQRCKRYAYGRQWDDPAPGGTTEAEAARQCNRQPLTNNLIRQLVKTVIGRYRALADERKTYVAPPGSDCVRNQLAELDSRMLEEFLISGTAVQRIVAERRMQGTGVWVDNVNPDRFFCNAYRDPRGFDMELCGMLHDMSPAEVLARFGGGDPGRHVQLRRIYGSMDAGVAPMLGATDFHAAAPGKWRVVEVWTLDAVRARGKGTEGKRGRRPERLDFVWQCRWLAPDGSLLAAYESPFAHGSHPFAVRHYPLTDGEVHSFVADLLDQQRCINRLITAIDHILDCSAKGVLLFPIEQMAPNMTWDKVCEAWASADGVIPISGSGNMPQQVGTTGVAAGAYPLLALQMKIFDDISGVGDTLLGRNEGAAKGASLYEAQVHNATIALYDLLLTFDAFRRQRDEKMKNC
ncbi:MAG: hypothetical protein K2M12_04250 [Muribaculaceae bacterium]|nr:hypothetical protein [Muribaculaceae bacterium]